MDNEKLFEITSENAKTLAELLEWPETWDTVAYPTLFHALVEFCSWQRAFKEKDNDN